MSPDPLMDFCALCGRFHVDECKKYIAVVNGRVVDMHGRSLADAVEVFVNSLISTLVINGETLKFTASVKSDY